MGEDCETKGNEKCLLDFESSTSHSIGVRVTDSGNQPMSKEFTLTVDVDDDNDSPYNLAMKAENLPENLPIGSKVATITVSKVVDLTVSQVATLTVCKVATLPVSKVADLMVSQMATLTVC